MPSAYGQRYPVDGKDGLGLDRDRAIQHAAAAIQSGADLNAVRARLIEMAHGDPTPPSPFSDLVPKGEPGMMEDPAPPPVQALPAFGDQGGLVPRSAGASFALDPLGRLPRRLDPRLAPQKSDFAPPPEAKLFPATYMQTSGAVKSESSGRHPLLRPGMGGARFSSEFTSHGRSSQYRVGPFTFSRSVPTPYQSGSALRDHQGRLVRNFFFRENPEKLMDPPP